jgi:hypothetical protein
MPGTVQHQVFRQLRLLPCLYPRQEIDCWLWR